MIENGQRLFCFIGALSFKALLAIAVPFSTLLGAAFGEGLTNQWGAAGLAGAIAGTMTTAMLVIPRIMEQRRKMRWSESETREKETNNLIERMSNFYELQIESMKKSITIERMISAERDLIATLERRAKHRIHSQLTSAEIKISNPQVPYTSRPYEALTGPEDELVQKAKERIAAVAGGAVAALT